jgi:hypothetical protein
VKHSLIGIGFRSGRPATWRMAGGETPPSREIVPMR